MSDERSVATWVHKNRMRLKLTQEALAAKVGVIQATVAHWENGRSSPRPDTLAKLEQQFNQRVSTDIALAVREEGEDSVSDPASSFGRWLETTRRARSMTVAELAELSGLTSATIYNIESGRSQNPQKATRDFLAAALKSKIPENVERETEAVATVDGFGTLIDFEPNGDIANLPQCAGVYIIYDALGRPTYIGQSKNIAQRIGQHGANKNWWAVTKLVDSAAYLEISDERRRRAVEKLLIKFIGPYAIFNKHHTGP